VQLKVYVVEHPDIMVGKGQVLFVSANTMQEAVMHLSSIRCVTRDKYPKDVWMRLLERLVRRAVARDSFFLVPAYTNRGIIEAFETKDAYGKEVILKNAGDTVEQVMMEWERDYMNACVDKLEPYGNVLELGFGLGYSASRIQEHKVASYTAIECDPSIYKKALAWGEQYDNVRIVHDRWQNVISSVGKFDCIFFDTFEPEVAGQSVCEQYTRILMDAGKDTCRLGYYTAVNNIENHKQFWAQAVGNLFEYSMRLEPFEANIPDNCLYARQGSLYTAVVNVQKRP
jgi:protein-L-isoaspartate O-methyltransferase